jgi:DNA replication and repair protein RecF
VALELDGAAAATFASEGQQRTLALALRLGQADLIRARRGVPPIYLVDDVFGELDPDRRRRLLAALPADTQRILTATSLQWLEVNANLSETRWTIKSGTIICD